MTLYGWLIGSQCCLSLPGGIGGDQQSRQNNISAQQSAHFADLEEQGSVFRIADGKIDRLCKEIKALQAEIKQLKNVSLTEDDEPNPLYFKNQSNSIEIYHQKNQDKVVNFSIGCFKKNGEQWDFIPNSRVTLTNLELKYILNELSCLNKI